MTTFEDLAVELTKLIETTESWAASSAKTFQDLKFFSIESCASAGIYQSLCLACPVSEHEAKGHTAQISLIMPHPLPKEQKRKREKGPPPTTECECHMAIKSTVNDTEKRSICIWLKVVSNVTHDRLEMSKRRPSHSGMAPKGRQTAKTRRASTDTSSSAPPPIRVCPEYLAQYEKHNVLVMQMEDPRGTSHNVYYLPSSGRPCDDLDDGVAWPISLWELLDLIDEQTEYEVLCDLPWQVHTARLVAEAVLRFDRLGPNRGLAKDEVIFYRSHARRDVKPFLQVEIQKSDGSASNTVGGKSEGDYKARRAILLNLGRILLELGLLKKVHLKSNELADQNLIREHCSDIGIGEKYANVVRSCINFFNSSKNNQSKDVVGFQQKYYEMVVYPLQQMDETLGDHSSNPVQREEYGCGVD